MSSKKPAREPAPAYRPSRKAPQKVIGARVQQCGGGCRVIRKRLGHG